MRGRSTGTKFTREEQEQASKNLNQNGLFSPDKQSGPVINPARGSQRRFTAEEKGKAVVPDSPAEDPHPNPSAAGAAAGQLKFRSAVVEVADDGFQQIKGKHGETSRDPRQPQDLPPSLTWKQQRASVFSLLGNGGPSVTATPGPLRALFRERAAGRCFRCLASDHKVAECQDPLRCIICLNSGHHSKDCRLLPEILRMIPVYTSPVPSYSEIPSMQSDSMNMGFILPGAGQQRPEVAVACAPFSGATATSERDLARHAVVAVLAGGMAVTRTQVAMACAVRFQIAKDEVEVSLHSQAGDYLVYFKDPAHRAEALRYPPYLWMGSSVLKLTPWTIESQATALKLYYKVRVCIERVPRHAWQAETVGRLFHGSILVADGIDGNNFADKESACVSIWVWTDDPNSIPKAGVLLLEDPPEKKAGDEPYRHPELGFVDQRRQACFEPVRVLSYNVLLHIDRVIDFSPASAASSSEQQWMRVFSWQLGIKDGELPPPASKPLVPSRFIGFRKPDRLPPN